MRTGDVIQIARQRAQLTQQQLADRAHVPRESIVRWEAGQREPGLSTLQTVVEAAGLDLVIQLAERDDSFNDVIDDQLRQRPLNRLRRLLPAGELAAAKSTLRRLAAVRSPSIVVGGVAGALQGAPQQLRHGRVDIVPADPQGFLEELGPDVLALGVPGGPGSADESSLWTLARGGTLSIARRAPGGGDFAGLRRAAEPLDLGGATVTVAHPRDLLRLAEASPHEEDAVRVPALRALLRIRNERDA